MPLHGPPALTFAIWGPITRSDLPGLCARVCRLLEHRPDAAVALCDVRNVEPNAVTVDALARLCADRRGTRSLDLPGSRTAERRYERLRFGSQSEKSASNVTEEVAVDVAGIYLLAGMPVEVTAGLYDALGAQPLTLRHVRPGDRIRHRKLQDVLVDAKVPRPERATLPVLARGSDVVWVSGLRLTGKGAVQ